MDDTCNSMHYCLFFTANAMCRALTRIADEEFAPTGLAPSQTYLLMMVIDSPTITQKQLGENMQLAPSTITRFIDNLVLRGLVTKQSEGKSVQVTATKAGKNMKPVIQAAWEKMYKRYSDALGKEAGDDLAVRLDQAVRSLEK